MSLHALIKNTEERIEITRAIVIILNDISRITDSSSILPLVAGIVPNEYEGQFL